MTRKDYVVIARAIGSAGLSADDREAIVSRLVGPFVADNDRFDRDRFRAEVERIAGEEVTR